MSDRRILLLVRHAKSSWKDQSLADIDRPLNRRGQQNAPDMGQRLRQRGLVPDVIVSSPAVRAIATAGIIAEHAGFSGDIIVNNGLYEATAAEVLNVVRTIDHSIKTAMIVGHNPTLTELANHFNIEEIENVPTCGIVTLSVSDWKQPETAEFLDLDYPKKQLQQGQNL